MALHLADPWGHPGFNSPETEVKCGNHAGLSGIRIVFHPAPNFPFHDPPQGIVSPAANQGANHGKPFLAKNFLKPVHGILFFKKVYFQLLQIDFLVKPFFASCQQHIHLSGFHST